MTASQYYIRARGKIRGPFDVSQLRALRERGQFSSFHEVSEDRQTWAPASTLLEVFAPLARIEDQHTGSRPPAPPRSSANDSWYYLTPDGQKRGPVSRQQLLFLRQDGVISDSTLIWREGMSDWRQIASHDIGLPPNPNDEFALVGAVRQSRSGMEGGIDKMLWYDANKKSVFVAYLLWWFLGTFGAHRFYFGKIGTAVGMLLITPVVTVLIVFLVFSSLALKIKDPEIYLLIWILFWTLMAAAATWWFIDAFLIPIWTRDYNNRLIRRLG